MRIEVDDNAFYVAVVIGIVVAVLGIATAVYRYNVAYFRMLTEHGYCEEFIAVSGARITGVKQIVKCEGAK